jgi:hypothetical protein
VGEAGEDCEEGELLPYFRALMLESVGGVVGLKSGTSYGIFVWTWPSESKLTS